MLPSTDIVVLLLYMGVIVSHFIALNIQKNFELSSEKKANLVLLYAQVSLLFHYCPYFCSFFLQ